jgi:hypothetical protein
MIFAIPTIIFSYKSQKSPFSYLSRPGFYLGLSKGTLQSLIIPDTNLDDKLRSLPFRGYNNLEEKILQKTL